MSKQRHLSGPPFEQKHRTLLRTTGQRICVWCGNDILEKGRRRWCSQTCVDQYLIRKDSTYLRRAVKERDNGVCACCGVDTKQLTIKIKQIKESWWQAKRAFENIKDRLLKKPSIKIAKDRLLEIETEFALLKKEFCSKGFFVGGYAFDPHFRSFWEADHIVPVVEGGGSCGLENIRTLCIPCHRVATKELRARLSKKRKKPVDQSEKQPDNACMETGGHQDDPSDRSDR